MEVRCYHKILRSSFKERVTNEEIRAKIEQAIGPHEDLTIVKKRKLQWYGRVCRSSDLAKIIPQGTVKGGRRRQGDRRRGGKTTPANGQAWSSPSPRGQGEQRKMEETGCEIICGIPTTLAVKE